MTSYSLYQILLALTSVCATTCLALVLQIIIKCRLGLWSYKRRSKGLPMYEDISLLGNHLLTFILAPNYSQRNLEAHKRLGKTFGFLQFERINCSTVDLDIIKKIVLDEGNVHLNRTKTDFPLKEIEESILMAEDEQWRKLRRYFAPAVKSAKFKTPNVLEEIDNSIMKLIDHIEDKLNSQAESRDRVALFEVDDLMHKFNLQVVFSCFYKQYDLINYNDEPSYWVKMVDDSIRAILSDWIPKIGLFFPVINPFIDWLVRNFHPQGEWRRSVVNFIKQQTRQAMEARKELAEASKTQKVEDQDNFRLRDGQKFKRNMVDNIIDHYLDGKLTKDEFFHSSFLMLLAADKTTTDALIFTVYLLASNAREQKLARESVRVAGYEADYLGWVINESLRLMPPAPAACSRKIKHDIEIEGGYIMPAGTFVTTPAFTIHRLKEYWGEDADEFRPERWADTSHHHPLQYIPFGAGQRSCIGREFALFEMKKTLAALLARYEFEAKHKDDAYIFETVYLSTIVPNSPTYVTIKRLSES